MSFEEYRDFFMRRQLSGWIKTDCNMGNCAPMRIIAAREILVQRARESDDDDFKRKAANIIMNTDKYLFVNSRRPDWQNLNQYGSDSFDQANKEAVAVPEVYREQDSLVLEQILLASIIE